MKGVVVVVVVVVVVLGIKKLGEGEATEIWVMSFVCLQKTTVELDPLTLLTLEGLSCQEQQRRDSFLLGPTQHLWTKWKRQTAVGLELLAEAGNYAALQRLYGQHYWPPTPSLAAHLTPTLPAGVEAYYRHVAAALSQRTTVPPRPFLPHALSQASPLSSLSQAHLSSLSSHYYSTLTSSLSPTASTLPQPPSSPPASTASPTQSSAPSPTSPSTPPSPPSHHERQQP
ncbi:Homeobox protein B-H2-like 1 [Homarus americanus]|uniref:Homeobox protein B-H2-like 1 n=1 Tax=Homarus americanus TaxID=6706 RepID=A0A8J5N5A6_HOMAM|nr:Homeobox protein B-H2-like 1 [Homarus americanus]